MAAQSRGLNVQGPYPADTLFQPHYLQNADAVLAMYHDQGLAPFKTLAYEEGVNYTAGLPFIRTSPDHGTAYDLAGQNLANPNSFRNALYLAIDIFNNRKLHDQLTTNPLSVSSSENG